MMRAISVDLCSVPADFGQGANDGAYYPVGLLTIGSHIRRSIPDVSIRVVDLHHQPGFVPAGDIVGISASSTLNYRNVLRLAAQAKAAGSVVVLGGPHATQLAHQILRNRSDTVDFVVRGNGETSFTSLVRAFRDGRDYGEVPNLSWRDAAGEPVHNPETTRPWRYDEFLPLDFSLLSTGIKPYWQRFRQRIDAGVGSAFVLFTHFGCGYREMMRRRSSDGKLGSGTRLARWCSYCSLDAIPFARDAADIIQEALRYLRMSGVPPHSRVLLKCYGDNVGTQVEMLRALARCIDMCDAWPRERIEWTFYTQSSRISHELLDLFQRVGTRNLYVGFDSADNTVQRMNGLGTSLTAHRRAVDLCMGAGIRIQAGFVLGCAGETRRSVENTVRFAEDLAQQGVLERINSAILFVIPGSPAYSLLCQREPWIRELDDLPTEELQRLWIRHFCPHLGSSVDEAVSILRSAANRLDALSPGPHASMGFISDRLAKVVSRHPLGATVGASAGVPWAPSP